MFDEWKKLSTPAPPESVCVALSMRDTADRIALFRDHSTAHVTMVLNFTQAFDLIRGVSTRKGETLQLLPQPTSVTVVQAQLLLQPISVTVVQALSKKGSASKKKSSCSLVKALVDAVVHVYSGKTLNA